MRVLHVIDSLRRGGAETLVVDLVDELARTGAAVPSLLVVDPAGADPGLIARAQAAGALRHLGGPPLHDPRLVVRVRRAMAGADVVHAHLVFAAVSVRLAARLGRRVPDVATVHTAPGALAHGTRARTLADLHTAFLSRRLIAPARSIAEAHRAACRPRPRAVDVVPNAAVPRPPTPGRPPSATRTELGVPPSALFVLALARLDPGKGLVDAVAAVARTDGARLVVAGEGPQGPELERLADAAGAGDRVRLLGRRDDVGDLLSAADVLCLPSYHEALPISVIEALHAGVPVVATRVGALPEILDDGRCGVLVEPGDVAALTAALARLEDPAVRRRLGRAGQDRAARRHSMSAMAAAYARVYAELTP